MKAMTQKQLAYLAGISSRTLQRWLEPHRAMLEQMGYHQGMRLIPPNVVEWIVRQFCLDL